MKHLFLASMQIGLLLTGSAAMAADLPAKAPPPAAVVAVNWTGFYVGGNVGGAGNRREFDFIPGDAAAAGLLAPTGNAFVLSSGSFNTVGAVGGVQLGYNWQIDSNWLLGLEADFDWSGMRGSATVLGTGVLNPSAYVDERLKWFGTVRGRLGFLPTDKFLLYVTGGFAYGNVEHSASLSSHATGGFSFINDPFGVSCGGVSVCFAGTSSKTATGWTVGAGFEYMVWRNVSVKAEYLYVDLGTDTVIATALNSGSTAAIPATVHVGFDKIDFHVARVGVNFRF